jgi:hypothetical protein
MRTRWGLLESVVVAGTAILLCLLAGELVVRVFLPVRDVGPSFTIHDARYGKVLKPSSSLTRITPEFTMRMTTNSRGFRGPELGSLGGGTILFVGDSFTMGYGVNDGEEFPAIVRQSLARCRPPLGIEVVNAGIGDSGTGRVLNFLRYDAAALKPRIVVLQIHATDFDDNVNERLYQLADSGELLQLVPPPPGMGRAVQRVIESVPGLAYSHLVGLSRQIKLPQSGTATPDGGPLPPVAVAPGATHEDRLTLRLLEEVVRITRERGWQLLVILADIPRGRHDLLVDFFAQRGITSVSVPTREERPDLYFRIDGHWNAKGQAFAAERILQSLRLPAHESQSDCRLSG